MNARDFVAAERLLVQLSAAHPTSIDVRHAKALLHFNRQQWPQAEALWDELRKLKPEALDIVHGYGATLARMGRFKEARTVMQGVVQQWPDFLLARLNLAGLLRQEFRQPRDALVVLEPALEKHGSNPTLHFNMGRARQDLLDTEGAMACYARALELEPGHVRAFSAYPFCTHYLPQPDLRALRGWIESHGRALKRPASLSPRPAPRSPGPRLRLGLLSGDLLDHPVAYFLESVLAALHRLGVELFAYSTSEKVDELSLRLQRSVSEWRPVAALSDAELANRIADDRLDVLMDLAGFTNHHRLGALLMRPAPLQVSWLGYFGTQGVPEIDAVLADPHCLPIEEQALFTERVLYMPDTRLCMSPPVGAPDPVAEPPSAHSGGLRFACLQNLNKINARVLACWRRILDGAPDATLTIQGRQLSQADVREAFEARLAASGIDRNRVELGKPSGRADYLAGYARFDVLLDTFPYPGGTTTAEAIWMGVPTLTLATPGMLGRQGQGLLHAVGLDDWITHSDEDYVARAIALAKDRDGTLTALRQLRRHLRATAQTSPLFDADAFARNLEALLRRACTEGLDRVAGQVPKPLPPLTDAGSPAPMRDKALQVAHFNALMQAGDLQAAEPVLQDLLARDPGAHALRQAHANMLTQLGRAEQAQAQWRVLVHEQPEEANNLFGHAQALQALRRHDEAIARYEQVLQRSPDFLRARLQLARLLRDHAKRPTAALGLLNDALVSHGQFADLHLGIARTQHDLLDPEGAMNGCTTALRLDPASIVAYSTYAYCAHHTEAPDLDTLKQWLIDHASSLKRPPTSLARPRAHTADKRLRVGLLSGDFKDHPVTYFLESVLTALKAHGLELFAYATSADADSATHRVRATVDHWCEATSLNDLALARRIADDQLDVLLDLAGFTNHSRLGVLLMKPAPVQLSWLGYFGSLGVPEIDGVIADPHCVPPGEERFFVEPVLRMPSTRLCMSPPEGAPEPSPEPPCAAQKGLRFGCLQDLKKITPRVLSAWRRILDGAPDARLRLFGRQVAEPDVCAVFEQRLTDSGIDRSRIEFSTPCSRPKLLARLDQIDVLLDTFPYPGGTTTAEALWMGVPTLTLATPGMLGRQGQALLHNVGLDDWVTHGDEAYVARAIGLANGGDSTLSLLRHLRQTLRETARKSPLFDAETFARDFAQLLRRVGGGTKPADTPAQIQRFNALVAGGKFDEAEQTLRALLARDPGAASLRQALAALLFHRERWVEVAELLQELVRTHPDDSTQHYRLGVALRELGQLHAARQAFETAVQQSPEQLQPRLSLAKLLQRHYQQPRSALEVLRPALDLHNNSALLHSEMALMQQDLLDTDGALVSYQRAIERDPSYMTAFGAYAFCMHYQSAPELDALLRWQTQHAPALRRDRLAKPTSPARKANAALRVGLLSGDLRQHPVAFFLESVVAQLRQRGMELVAYSTDKRHDEVSQRLQQHTFAWHPVAGMSDAALAQRIADDRLDVLLDLSGYTSHGRPQVLLMRPAPLQLSWLGYFGNLGLPEVDGVIADPHCVPSGEERFFTGHVLRMPASRLCFTPPQNAPATALEPPMATNDGLRFACLQDLNKINARVLAAWRCILDGAPQASLLIQGRQLAQPEVRAEFETRLDASGIDRRRVTLGLPRSREDYLAQYAEVDVLLDTFPYPGGTTTAEAIWMGVPTLTLATPGMLGRQGQAMLHLVGLDDWITHSDDDYVNRAVALAQNRGATLNTLRGLRASLRETARNSPLFDAERFAHDFETLLRRACKEGIAAAANSPAQDKTELVARFNERLQAGDLTGAEPSLLELLARDPGASALRQVHAGMLGQLGRHLEAEAQWRRLIGEQPEEPGYLAGLAGALQSQARNDEAMASLRQALHINPDSLNARLDLAQLLRQHAQRPREALALLNDAPAGQDKDPMLQVYLGAMHQELLDAQTALSHYQRAIDLDPQLINAYGAYPFCAHYLPELDLDALRDWVQRHHAALLRPSSITPVAAREPGTRLRLGILSADLRDHPVAYFLEGVLAALSKRGVEVIAYSTSDLVDAVSQRLQGSIKTWRQMGNLPAAVLAKRIADDRLDVLLDLAGMTQGHRIEALTHHPAPVQLGWVGYFGTVGSPPLDGVIADPCCVPPEEERFFTERVHRMPHTRLCFTPPVHAPLPSLEPPLSAQTGLRFGCFQNPKKINQRVLKAWHRILESAPTATLVIRGRLLAKPDVREVFEQQLDQSGIDRKRVELWPPADRNDYLAGYAKVDVLLDTFPYPGGTTTCEAIWMGVPTLTLATPGMLGRQGQALLQQVGLSDWVAHSDDDYVQRAVVLASDRDGTLRTLRSLRRSLRDTARQSPLFDAERFAGDFEALLRRVCAERIARAVTH